MNLNDAVEPKGTYIRNAGTYDLIITNVESKYASGKEYFEIKCQNTDKEELTFRLYNTDSARWWIKMLALSCGLTEKDLSDFHEKNLVGRVFKVNIKSETANNGKTYLVPDVRTFAISTVKISEFDEDVPF